MLNISKIQLSLRAISLVFALSGTFSLALADDLLDAKNAYGAGQFEEAATLLRPLVRQENIAAVYLLARMYEQGDGVDKDLVEAKRLFRIAAKAGNEDAQQRLDIFDAQGADDSVVIEWYLPSAEEGDTEAQYNLGFMYETGWGVRVDEAKAVQWYREAAEMQHDIAQLRLGMMLVTGGGVAQSINDGLSLIRQSAENGNTVAELLIQDLFDADDVDIEDAIRIVTGIRRVLDEGEEKTLKTLRHSIELLHKPIVTARKAPTIRQLAKQPKRVDIVQVVTGNKPSLVSEDDSITTLIKGTEKKSQSSLSDNAMSPPNNTPPLKSDKIQLPTKGEIPRGNLFLWYLNMANQGDADSQYHTGAMYVKGDQVEQDTEEGVRWIRLAADQGHELAEIYMKLWDEDFGVNTFESTIAVRWLKEAGRKFDLDSVFNLAFLYETGRGVPRNYNTAKQWYKFASVEGHEEAKRRLDLLNKNELDPSAVSLGAKSSTEPDMPVIIGLFVVLLISIAIYFYYRRNKSAPITLPSMEMGENDVITQAKNTAGLQVDDKKLFDELWETSGSADPFRDSARSGKSGKKDRKNMVPGDAEEKASELSEVEQKLAQAIDDLMSIGQKGQVSESNAGAGSEGKPVDKSKLGINSTPENERNAAKPHKADVQVDRQGAQEKIATLNEKISIASVRERGSSQVHTAKEKFASERLGGSLTGYGIHNGSQKTYAVKNHNTGQSLGVGEYAAESFLSNGISMDELAAGRVSADNLFADGVAIDEAGTAIGQGNYNPSKLDANEMIGTDNISLEMKITKDAISSDTSMTRPVGAAASLLPKQSSASKFNHNKTFDAEMTYSDDIVVAPSVSVDVTAPMTNREERSLAEVHYNIGLMFSEGDGVPQNEAQAAKWFLKAAEEGMPEAQFNIGQRYLSGQGVAKDLALGMKWIQKSANNNYKPAQKELEKKNRAS